MALRRFPPAPNRQGLEAVRAEMSLTVLAYNLKRVLNILSFADLMKAVAVQA